MILLWLQPTPTDRLKNSILIDELRQMLCGANSARFHWSRGSTTPSVPSEYEKGASLMRPEALHYTTLHYTTLHYTTLHYATLHCTILCATLYYTCLYFWPDQPCNYFQGKKHTTLHYITLHYTTLHLLLSLVRPTQKLFPGQQTPGKCLRDGVEPVIMDLSERLDELMWSELATQFNEDFIRCCTQSPSLDKRGQ